MDRFDAMRVFVSVAKMGSFSEAARRLQLSPSVVTRAIAQLEDELGLTLLLRTTRSLRLTERGELYLESCRRILEDVEGAERQVRGEDAVLDYCRSAQAFAEKEQFRILFLDKRNQLIADEVQQTGTVDHTPVYPREVVKRALELSATAIILVHNHPSGDPTPSQADIKMTQQIIAVTRPLGITVHDHIIVGKNGHVSLRGLKVI